MPINEEPFCYIASPLGFSEPGRGYYYQTLIPLVESAGFTVLDPWTLTPQRIFEDIQEHPLGELQQELYSRANKQVGAANTRGIERCRLLLGVLDGSDVDSGTAGEIGYAAAKDKMIEGYRSDFRLAGDNLGAVVNLQVEYFIRTKGGGEISATAKKLLERLIYRRKQLLGVA